MKNDPFDFMKDLSYVSDLQRDLINVNSLGVPGLFDFMKNSSYVSDFQRDLLSTRSVAISPETQELFDRARKMSEAIDLQPWGDQIRQALSSVTSEPFQLPESTHSEQIHSLASRLGVITDSANLENIQVPGLSESVRSALDRVGDSVKPATMMGSGEVLQSIAPAARSVANIVESLGVKESLKTVLGELEGATAASRRVRDLLASSGYGISSSDVWGRIGRFGDLEKDLEAPFGKGFARLVTELADPESLLESALEIDTYLESPSDAFDAESEGVCWSDDQTLVVDGETFSREALEEELSAVIQEVREEYRNTRASLEELRQAVAVSAEKRSPAITKFAKWSTGISINLVSNVLWFLLLQGPCAVVPEQDSNNVTRDERQSVVSAAPKESLGKLDVGEQEFIYDRFRMVNTEALDVRANSDEDSRVVGRVFLGRMVELLDSRGDWALISWKNGDDQLVKGWVLVRHLTRLGA